MSKVGEKEEKSIFVRELFRCGFAKLSAETPKLLIKDGI